MMKESAYFTMLKHLSGPVFPDMVRPPYCGHCWNRHVKAGSLVLRQARVKGPRCWRRCIPPLVCTHWCCIPPRSLCWPPHCWSSATLLLHATPKGQGEKDVENTPHFSSINGLLQGSVPQGWPPADPCFLARGCCCQKALKPKITKIDSCCQASRWQTHCLNSELFNKMLNSCKKEGHVDQLSLSQVKPMFSKTSCCGKPGRSPSWSGMLKFTTPIAQKKIVLKYLL